MGSSFGNLVLATMALIAVLLIGGLALAYLDPVDQALARAVAWGAP